MKKISLIVLMLGLTLIACKKEKNNYCYSCTANKSYNGQTVSESECDLSKSDRDYKADKFENDHPIGNQWDGNWTTVTCTRTSE